MFFRVRNFVGFQKLLHTKKENSPETGFMWLLASERLSDFATLAPAENNWLSKIFLFTTEKHLLPANQCNTDTNIFHLKFT